MQKLKKQTFEKEPNEILKIILPKSIHKNEKRTEILKAQKKMCYFFPSDGLWRELLSKPDLGFIFKEEK